MKSPAAPAVRSPALAASPAAWSPEALAELLEDPALQGFRFLEPWEYTLATTRHGRHHRDPRGFWCGRHETGPAEALSIARHRFGVVALWHAERGNREALLGTAPDGEKLLAFARGPTGILLVDTRQRVYQRYPNWQIIAETPSVFLARLLHLQGVQRAVHFQLNLRPAVRVAQALSLDLLAELTDSIQSWWSSPDLLLCEGAMEAQADADCSQLFLKNASRALDVLRELGQLGISAWLEEPREPEGDNILRIHSADSAKGVVVPRLATASRGRARESGGLGVEGNAIVQVTTWQDRVLERIAIQSGQVICDRYMALDDELTTALGLSQRGADYLKASGAYFDPREKGDLDEVLRLDELWHLPPILAVAEIEELLGGWCWGTGSLEIGFCRIARSAGFRGSADWMRAEVEQVPVVMVGRAWDMELFVDDEGRIYDRYPEFSRQPLPIADSIQQYIEGAAVLAATHSQPYRIAVPAFIGSELAPLLGAEIDVEASDSHRRFWESESCQVLEVQQLESEPHWTHVAGVTLDAVLNAARCVPKITSAPIRVALPNELDLRLKAEKLK